MFNLPYNIGHSFPCSKSTAELIIFSKDLGTKNQQNSDMPEVELVFILQKAFLENNMASEGPTQISYKVRIHLGTKEEP